VNEIAGSVFLPLLVRRCVGIRLSSLMMLPLASPVASLSGMTKISLVQCRVTHFTDLEIRKLHFSTF
jgi:hypothetical protein